MKPTRWGLLYVVLFALDTAVLVIMHKGLTLAWLEGFLVIHTLFWAILAVSARHALLSAANPIEFGQIAKDFWPFTLLLSALVGIGVGVPYELVRSLELFGQLSHHSAMRWVDWLFLFGFVYPIYGVYVFWPLESVIHGWKFIRRWGA